MKGRMCYIYLTETHSDGVLFCSILLTMAFTSECKADDLSIAAVAAVKAGRAPSSAFFRLQDGDGGGGVYEADGGDGARSEQREREIEHILYMTLPDHPPPYTLLNHTGGNLNCYIAIDFLVFWQTLVMIGGC